MMNNDEKRGFDIIKKFCDETPLSPKEFAFAENQGLIASSGVGYSLTKYGRDLLHGKVGDQAMNNENFESAVGVTGTEFAKRQFVAKFANGTNMSHEEIKFGQNHGLIFVNGGGWSLTEYGRNYLPERGTAPAIAMFSDDSDHTQCPDDDSYLPQPGRLDFGISALARDNHAATQEKLNQLNLDPPIPSAPSRGVLDVQVGGDHYKKMGHHQPWEVLATWMTPEELRGYMKGTVIAYLARERDKGGDLDIEKVQHTIELWQQVRKDKA